MTEQHGSRDYDKEHRLSPRATDNSSQFQPPLSSSSSGVTNLAASNPSLPLPDPSTMLNWDSLLETATKAFPGGPELGSKALSVGGELQDVSSAGGGDSRGGMKTSKSTELAKPRSETRHPTIPVSRSATANWWSERSGSSDRRGASSADGASRIQELEERCIRLEQQLKQESAEKSELEAEVEQLRVENEHLQEESQTAAAQLRRFTEWFFQTIDRQ